VKRLVTTILCGVLAAASLSGCSSGPAPRADQHPQPAFANGTTALIEARAVYIPAADYAAGGHADVYAHFVQNGKQADYLTGGSSPVAASATLVDAEGAPQRNFVLPFLAPVELGPGTGALRLENLRRSLHEGDHVSVTFTFTQAPPLTLSVPVRTG
jgi:copper(I)-binding protein